jgi:hypothetical protein
MVLLTYYTALSCVGVAIAAIIGLVVERAVPAASLPVFFLLFTVALWATWRFAVFLSAPHKKHGHKKS